MLQRYLQITQESIDPSQQPVRLRAMLRAGYGAEYPSFSLRVGYDRLYSVQNIREFLDNVSQRRTVVYGKGLTLEHNLELFEPEGAGHDPAFDERIRQVPRTRFFFLLYGL